jgi:SAM-dependent methyltransferase
MAEQVRARGSVRTAVIWATLREALTERTAATGTPLRVLDAGGGSGGFAVPIAELGHTVTVVDPSPDALAALEMRAVSAGAAARVRGIQGDVAGLGEALAGEAFDVALCHNLLEVVDAPAEALAGAASSLAPGGLLSVLAVNRTATVVHRAIAGRFVQARHVLSDPAGRYGEGDPMPRRFTVAEIEALLGGAGLRVSRVRGVRTFVDLLPGGLLDAEPAALQDLLELETAVSAMPEFQAIAGQLHVLAVRE